MRSINKKVLGVVAVAALAAGALLAQTTQTPSQGRGQRLRQFIAEQLSLTDAQKTQAQSIFDAARQQAKPIADQLRQGHDALAQAVKAGKSDAELQQLADQQGPLVAQLAGIHAKAFAKFYSLLTPDQKAKADQLHDYFRGMLRQHFGWMHNLGWMHNQ